MLPNIGMPELLVILVVVLLVFGAKRLPEMGSAMGKGIREFKRGIKDVQKSIEETPEDTPVSRRIDSSVAADGEPKKLSE
ncbi:MAG: twin-arginine translocase TatA/TatE family subunit [Gemmatimonadales bacterium]